MKKKIINVIAIFFLALSSLSAQKTHELDLGKAINLALQENRNIMNAKTDVIIAKKQVWETTAIGLPQVKTELNYQNMLDIPVTLLPAQIVNPAAPADTYIPLKFGQQHSASFSFSASQLLFSGEYIVGLQASKTYQELSQKAVLKSENDVIELVTKSYYTVLMTYANLKVLENSEKSIIKTYEEIKKVFEAGMADETNLDQIGLNVITIQNSISSLKRQIVVLENVLKYQIGISVNDQIIIKDSLEGVFMSSTFQNVLSQNFDINKNPDYQLLNVSKELSNLSLKREKASFLPTLAAFYSHNVSGQNNQFDDYFNGNQAYFQSNIVGVGLSWNIFNSGTRYINVQQAQLEIDKLENREYLLREGLSFQMEQAKSDLISAYDTYQKEEKNTKLAQKIYERSLIKFSNGLISSNELTSLHLQHINSQIGYYSAIMNVLNAQAVLDKIMGNNLKN
jgi:outer membrane protein TolC